MSLTITLRDYERIPVGTIEVDDTDEQLLIEALYVLREKKVEAMHTVNQSLPRSAPRQFTAEEFGIPRIAALIKGLEGE